MTLQEYVDNYGSSYGVVRKYFQSLPGGGLVYEKYHLDIIRQYEVGMRFEDMDKWFLERLKEITPAPIKKTESDPQLSLF